MSKTFEQGKDEIATLCRYFANNRQSFLAPGVKEAHVRQSLIDPFFEALGWDMRNASMAAPQYREVVTENTMGTVLVNMYLALWQYFSVRDFLTLSVAHEELERQF